MTNPKAKTHIRDPRWPSRAICGRPWVGPIRGGRAASDTSPPVVIDDETGSVNPTTCRKCIELMQAAMKRK